MRGVYVPISSVRGLLCAVAESVILVVALPAAAALRFSTGLHNFFEYDYLTEKAVLNALVLQMCLYYSDLYEDYAVRRRVELYLRFGQAFLVGTLLLSLIYYVAPDLTVGRGILLIYLPLSLGLILAWRTFYLWISGREGLSDAVLILGTGESAQQIASEVLRRGPLGFKLVGFVGEHEAEVGRRLVNPAVIGTTQDLISLVEQHRITLIVVALDDRRGKMPVADLLRCRLAGVRVEEANTLFERLTGRILLRNLRPSLLVFSHGFNKPRLLRASKRVAELAAALILFVLTAPPLALLVLLIKLESRGPVFYRQRRVGEKGRTFTLYKLRTMRADAEAGTGAVWASPDGDPRITRVGRHLRKLRLDELPQLLNVLKGDMSFVGPRPERPEFVESLRKVIPYYDERHSVKPGITGWAQIKFSYGSTIEDAEDKLQFDLYYIKHMSFILDLGILLDTLKVMVVGKGAR